jgi:flavin reductase (DIM6/NTAB) family NADH-FMN oxidoreductase RutF
VSERSGVARLTRVVKVAPPSVSTGLMPPPRVTGAEHPDGEHPAGRRESHVAGAGPTGVTVVTTTHRSTIHGMTANAFLSVSLRPPLVLVSLGRCRMSEMLPRTGRYAVSVLAADQEELAAHFAGQRVAATAPEFVWEHDLPVLAGALAHVSCRVVDVHAAGDHVLWIGEVEHLSHRNGEPLLFYTGRFGTLREVSEAASAGD